jgi:hypothetical protein
MPGWPLTAASQAAFAAALAFLAGFLMAGYRMAGPQPLLDPVGGVPLLPW